MTRPEGKSGDTGLLWAGSHRAASESLMHATRDDDPRCVAVFAQEAIDAGQEALKAAKNARQRIVTDALLSAAHQIKIRARRLMDAGKTVMDDD